MIENTFGKDIVPKNDEERLSALKRYQIIDTPPEGSFDNIAKLATLIFNVPISLVSLVDSDRVFFKANVGMGKAKEVNRGKSLCSLAVLEPEVTVFEDALKEPCLIATPNVAGDFGLRFYAGAPLTTHDGFMIGTLCIIDKKPRIFTEKEKKILAGLAVAVMDQIELRLTALEEVAAQQKINNELAEQREAGYVINEELTATNEELRESKEFLEQSNTDLAESESRFRTLVKQAPVGIIIYNGPDLVIEQANHAMLEQLGRTDDIIGKPLLQARPEVDGHPYVDIIRGVLSSGKEHTGTGIKAPVRFNGEVKDSYFDVTYKPIKDNTNQITGVMAVTTDVTEKTVAQQREKEMMDELAAINEELTSSNEELSSSQEHLINVNHSLIESESRFRVLIEQAPVAISTMMGREMVVDIVNDMMLKIWGRDRSVIGKPIHIALPELEGQPFLQILDDVFTSGKPYYGNEAKVSIDHDGELRDSFVNFVYQPIKGADATTKSIMVVATDVTEQVNSRLVLKQKNEELQLLAEQLAYVSNSIPQQVWTATPDGMLDFVNEKTIQYFGKPIDEITGENWIKLVHPADLEVAGGAWMHSLTTGETYQTEFRLLSKDEKYVWHLARAIPVIEAGKIVKWFGTNTDIEEQKQLEQHKNDFISIASHELKTPITTLKMSLQLLDKIKNNPPAAMLIKLIEQSNRGMQKLSSLVDDLLSVSRMKEGQLNLNKMTFNLAELLRDSCSYAGADGMHEIIMECGPELSVFADAHLIEQVVVNFVNNAVKYAPESKEIYVVAEQGDNFVKISVNDTGPGISADKVPHLFDRYYRADHSGRQYSGLGLGLYISSEIIKRHSGQIGVDSEVGKGSKFWFTLPANG